MKWLEAIGVVGGIVFVVILTAALCSNAFRKQTLLDPKRGDCMMFVNEGAITDETELTLKFSEWFKKQGCKRILIELMPDRREDAI